LCCSAVWVVFSRTGGGLLSRLRGQTRFVVVDRWRVGQRILRVGCGEDQGTCTPRDVSQRGASSVLARIMA
jgi:hypothetical protein